MQGSRITVQGTTEQNNHDHEGFSVLVPVSLVVKDKKFMRQRYRSFKDYDEFSVAEASGLHV